MTIQIGKCVKCGESFELKPDKPGYVNVCPDCSPKKILSPGEAKEAAMRNRQNSLDAAFWGTIAEKRRAETNQDWTLAAKLEEEIQKIKTLRIKIPGKKAESN